MTLLRFSLVRPKSGGDSELDGWADAASDGRSRARRQGGRPAVPVRAKAFGHAAHPEVQVGCVTDRPRACVWCYFVPYS